MLNKFDYRLTKSTVVVLLPDTSTYILELNVDMELQIIYPKTIKVFFI